jgi:DNA-binding HxlR family transcriptional regulator
VDFERLRQFDRLFQNRHEVFVVASLAVAGPLRFSQLAFTVQVHAGARIPDSTIAQILGRLCRADLVEKVTDHEGHGAYHLTTQGCATATVIATISHALDQCHESGDDTDTAAP